MGGAGTNPKCPTQLSLANTVKGAVNHPTVISRGLLGVCAKDPFQTGSPSPEQGQGLGGEETAISRLTVRGYDTSILQN